MSSNDGFVNFIYAGVLRFNGKPIITPMIESLFGDLNNNNLQFNSENLINFRQEDERNFSELANAFNENAQKLGIFDDKKRNGSQWLLHLSEHFKVDPALLLGKDYMSVVESSDDYSDILEINFLFKVAQLLNDGHNLHSIEYTYLNKFGEGAHNSGGGGGGVLSNQINYCQYSKDIVSNASRIDELYTQRNFEDAGFVIASGVQKLYDQLNCKDKSAVLDSLILHLQNNKNELALLDSTNNDGVNEAVNDQSNKKIRP